MVTPPAHGVLSGVAPALTYTPEADCNGPDSFTFTASGASAPATVTLDVTPVNDAPTAEDVRLAGSRGEALDIVLTGSDVDGAAQTRELVDPPAHGTLSGAGPTVTWTPEPGFAGTDTFTFRVNDGQADSPVVTVTLDVTNTAPIATPDGVAVDEDSALTITLAGSDDDGDTVAGIYLLRLTADDGSIVRSELVEHSETGRSIRASWIWLAQLSIDLSKKVVGFLTSYLLGKVGID